MALAQIPVLLTQKPSTENGLNREVYNFILSVDVHTRVYSSVGLLHVPGYMARRHSVAWPLRRGDPTAHLF